MSITVQPSVVLIDDNEEQLDQLHRAVESSIAKDQVSIKVWRPADGEDPYAKFEQIVDDNTVLVITDYDLTKAGLTGLFGVSIVSWCQARFIPVGDFSRGNRARLPSEPNLFELRVPTEIGEAARYTVAMFRGFNELRNRLSDGSVNFESARSPAEVLAAVIGRPTLESQLALYMSLLGAANASLLDSLRRALSEQEVAESEKTLLLSYVIGHVLANAVMRYPGPILSEEALCAYLATEKQEAAAVGAIFTQATYDGPFSGEAHFYWRDEVDRVISEHAPSLGDASESFETSGQFNRAVVEKALGRPLARHGCTRCGGVNGGYLCPFTERPVCERSDCSVAANSWIPPGADVCRVERDFYEEWAPLLGL